MNVLMTSATAMTTLKQHPKYGGRFSAVDSKMKEYNLELAGYTKNLATNDISDIRPTFIGEYMDLINAASTIVEEAFNDKVLLKEEFEAINFVFDVLDKSITNTWDEIITMINV